jgi:hypothetical protein
MLATEQRLTQTLIPVAPRPEFIQSLKAQLLQPARPSTPASVSTTPWVWFLALAGVVVSVIGLVALGWRAVTGALGLIARAQRWLATRLPFLQPQTLKA